MFCNSDFFGMFKLNLFWKLVVLGGQPLRWGMNTKPDWWGNEYKGSLILKTFTFQSGSSLYDFLSTLESLGFFLCFNTI